MTVQEFREEFNLLYDNISSNAAPGLDNYEISVYLTKAQLEIVKEKYLGSGGKASFEGNEKRRRELSRLVNKAEISTFTTPLNPLSPYSKLASIPEALFIIHEMVKLSSADECINDTIAEVVPVSYDEYFSNEENPFRKPNKRRAVRIDGDGDSSLTVELICPHTIDKYFIRYVRYPSPIIVSDLTTDPELIGLGLSIDGQTAAQTSELNSGVHREIVDRAVELAIQSYRENTLANKVQLDNRTEQ